MFFTEDTFEKAVLQIFENLGYTHLYGPDLDRDYSSPLLESVLQDSLVRLNRTLPAEAITEAIAKLKGFDSGSLLQKNMAFMEYLQNGVPVRYFIKGEERNSIVYLIDYQNVDRNCFYAVNQFTYIENGNNRRPDIVLFVNGLPLVLIELKSPSKDEVGAENAFNQIRNYMQDIPSIFYYNALCVISDLSTNKAGTITSGFDRFMEWKTKDGNYENTAYAQFDTFYEGIFQCERFIDILKNFICFSVTVLDYKTLIDSNWMYLYQPSKEWGKFCKISIFLLNTQAYMKSLLKNVDTTLAGYYGDIRAAKDKSALQVAAIGTSNYTDLAENIIGDKVTYLNGSLNMWYDPYLNRIGTKTELDKDEKHIIVPLLFTQSGTKPMISIDMSRKYVEYFNALSDSDEICIIGFGFNQDDEHINGMFRDLIDRQNKPVAIVMLDDQETERHTKSRIAKKLKITNTENLSVLKVDNERKRNGVLWLDSFLSTFKM